MRFDFHFTRDGWRISEVNSDVPGGLNESSGFERLMANTLRSVRGIAGYYRALYEMSLRGRSVWPRMRELEAYQGARIAELARRRGSPIASAELALSAQLVTRMVNGQIISVVLYGAGPFGLDDPRLPRELARLIVEHLHLSELGPAPR